MNCNPLWDWEKRKEPGGGGKVCTNDLFVKGNVKP